MGESKEMKRIRIFNGDKYVMSAATRYGVPLGDAKYNQTYLKKLGFSTRRVKVDGEYYVYARKVKNVNISKALDKIEAERR